MVLYPYNTFFLLIQREKMKRFHLIFSMLFAIFFAACNDSSSNNTNEVVYNGDYIVSIPFDTTATQDLAQAPDVTTPMPMLLILLEYDNQEIRSSQTTWAQKVFGDNQGELNNYYKEISHDRFYFTPVNESYDTQDDGVIKVHLNKDHLNTSINDDSFLVRLSEDMNNALSIADEYIDFSLYDTNQDGALESNEIAIVFVIAGYEDAYEGSHVYNGVWAHQGSLAPSDAPSYDGVTMFNKERGGKYAIFGELHDDHDATIGIIAHELGHAVFNLPDLYNITSSQGGIGIFGLMGAGSWTRKNDQEYYGATPVHMCAWSKSFIGWVTPQERSNSSTTLTQSASPDYDVIKIPISANHYYLLENRNDSGYDRGLRELEGNFVGGMVVWHINQNKLTNYHFETNTVNADTANKGVDVVEARNPIIDSQPNATGSAQALFYNPNRTTFGDKITDISAPGSVINLNIH